jgi:hypothetical protein
MNPEIDALKAELAEARKLLREYEEVYVPLQQNEHKAELAKAKAEMRERCAKVVEDAQSDPGWMGRLVWKLGSDNATKFIRMGLAGAVRAMDLEEPLNPAQ